MKMSILSLVIFVTTVMSCQKEYSSTKTCTTNEVSIAGSYKITAIKYKVSSAALEQDFFATLDPCEKDDIIKLNANNILDYQDVGTNCTTNGTYSSNWSLSDNSITMDGTTGTIQFFDCKKLVVVAPSSLIRGAIFTTTYEKK